MGSSSCGASQWPHQAWGQVLPSMDQESGEYQVLWQAGVTLITVGQEQQVAALQIADIELRHKSLAICSRRFIGLLDLLLLVVFSSPLKWDMESWHAERDPEVQWISAQQKIADIDCSRRWKPWLRWSLPFPTWNVLNAPTETSPRTGSRSSVECSHRRLPRWSSSQLLCPAQTWRVQLKISGRPFSMLPTLVQVRLGHNSIADVAYAGFLRPFVSLEGSSLKKIYVDGSGFGHGAAEALAELLQKQGLESRCQFYGCHR